jgi:hypothetical protein
MTAVQPEYEQPPLPFEDEVLVILYKREVPDHRLPEHWASLEWTLRSRAKHLGFDLVRTRRFQKWEGDTLNISLRAEAERT